VANHDVSRAVFRGMAADLMRGRWHTARLTLAAREEITLGLARENRFTAIADRLGLTTVLHILSFGTTHPSPVLLVRSGTKP
jgi:hypothetical protein